LQNSANGPKHLELQKQAQKGPNNAFWGNLWFILRFLHPKWGKKSV